MTTIAISSDGRERAAAMAEKIDAKQLRFGYDLDLKKAREWGLYISQSRGLTSIGIEEPKLFSEPGLFMISPDRSLYYGSVQTMPFFASAFLRTGRRPGFCHQEQLSGARRIYRSGLTTDGPGAFHRAGALSTHCYCDHCTRVLSFASGFVSL